MINKIALLVAFFVLSVEYTYGSDTLNSVDTRLNVEPSAELYKKTYSILITESLKSLATYIYNSEDEYWFVEAKSFLTSVSVIIDDNPINVPYKSFNRVQLCSLKSAVKKLKTKYLESNLNLDDRDTEFFNRSFRYVMTQFEITGACPE